MTATISATSVTLYVVHRTAVCCIVLLGQILAPAPVFAHDSAANLKMCAGQRSRVRRNRHHTQALYRQATVSMYRPTAVRPPLHCSAWAAECPPGRGYCVPEPSPLTGLPITDKAVRKHQLCIICIHEDKQIQQHNMHTLHALSYPSECLGKLTQILARVYSVSR